MLEIVAPTGVRDEMHIEELIALPPLDSTTSAESPTAEVVLYDWKTATLPPFRYKVQHRQAIEGSLRQFPAGIGGTCSKPDGIAEFFRHKIGESVAVGWANLLEPPSGQLTLDFERGLGLTLQNGRTYRLRVEYRTAAVGRGTLRVQETGEFRTLAATDLGPSTQSWRSVELSFRKVPGLVLRGVVTNASIGAENTIFVRSIQLLDAR
jgi:hypothetical protein